MKDLKVALLLAFTLLASLLFISCTEEDNPAQDNVNLVLNTFSFLKSNNKSLEEDFQGIIREKDSSITFYLRGVKDLSSLIATFDGEYYKVEVGGGRNQVWNNENRLHFCKDAHFSVTNRSEKGLQISGNWL